MSDEDRPAKRMGRPRKYASDAKRPTLTFRVRDGLYDKLKASAELSERSLSEEIEKRVDRTFEEEEYLSKEIKRIMGSDETQRILFALSTLMNLIEVKERKKWSSDLLTQAITYRALIKMIDRMFGDKPIPSKFLEDIDRNNEPTLNMVESLMQGSVDQLLQHVQFAEAWRHVFLELKNNK